MIKKIIKKYLPFKLKKILFAVNNILFSRNYSYSQEGEDLILNRFFEKQNKGFYIDVGAHHPVRFSNTYMFYKRGWSGINIDAMPNSMKIFNLLRPRDINLEIPISLNEKKMTYYSFNDPAINGFDKNLSQSRTKDYKLISKISLETKTLEKLLDKYLIKKEIDFLSIDVEGLDLEVLKSTNLKKYKPKIILVEILESNFDNLKNCDLYNFLVDNDYVFLAKTINTFFFKHKNIKT